MSVPLWGYRTKSADPLFRFWQNGKAGFIDRTGKFIVAAVLPATASTGVEFHDGLLTIGDGESTNVYNTSGKIIFRVSGSIYGEFSEGLAPVTRPSTARKWQSDVGFVDRMGRMVIDRKFTWADDFSDGLARVTTDKEVGSTGYIDPEGNYAVKPHLVYGYDFHDGLAAVIQGGPCRITNGGSCARVEFTPTSISSANCKFSYIDKAGQPVSEARFDDAGDFSEGLAPVRLGRQWGFINNKGAMVIPPQFDWAEPFSDGLAAVRNGEQFGFIDNSGKVAIPFQLGYADSFSDGLALITVSDAKGKSTSRFIDRTGKIALPVPFAGVTSFMNGLAHVTLADGRLGWINTSGKLVFTYRAPSRR